MPDHFLPDQFHNYSASAKEVIQQAIVEARSLNQIFCGTEHLLLSILNGSSIACYSLRSIGIDYEEFKSTLIKTVGRDGSPYKALEIPFTERAKKTFATAEQEAKNLGQTVDVNYLLFALMLVNDSLASRILAKTGKTRLDVLKSLQSWLGIY